MENKKRLTEKEFTQMIKLLHRYVNTEMDQWELWFFDTDLYRYINENKMFRRSLYKSE
jgi:hypothetical protein